MRNNRRCIKAWGRGRVTQGLILGVLGLFLVFSAGCISLNPFSRRPAQKKTYHRKRSKTRIPVAMDKGKIAYRTEKHEEINSEKIIPKETWMQWLGGLISGASILWLILFAVCPPAALMIGKIVFNKIRGMRNAIYETVRGIEMSKTVGLNGEVHNALSSAQSEKTKTYIRKLKAKIKSKL